VCVQQIDAGVPPPKAPPDRFLRRTVLFENAKTRIWRAKDQDTGVAVAIKEALAEDGSPEILNEMTILAQLEHDNVVRLLAW